MKIYLTIFAAAALVGCSSMKETTQQAKVDWYNFKKTIQYNWEKPAVYNKAYF